MEGGCLKYQEPSTVARQSQIKYGCKISLNLAISGFSKNLPILIVSEWSEKSRKGQIGVGGHLETTITNVLTTAKDQML